MTAGLPGTAERVALLLHVRGVVQGVGFRPFVHRLALREGLRGWVRNESGEVRIAIEGTYERLLAFLTALVHDSPPLSRIDSLEIEPTDPRHPEGFEIAVSLTDQAERRQLIAPDVAMCPACESELVEPGNRRFRYPFITCTDCGPRFTVIESMPYDRERTSMRAFTQCSDCLREYTTPWDRRYHSETNSCPACGPRLTLLAADPGSAPQVRTDPIASAARLLRLGLIVAVRGLGGFHLAVDATNDEAVRRLRRRKGRERKPLAVMVRTLDDARRVAVIGPTEERLLTGRERPIVLLRRLPQSGLAASVAPGLTDVGLMTAYTPLHHVLLDAVQRPLVMTSGNASEEPIATGVDEARQRLRDIADAFLVHDREIVARYDDSVVRVVEDTPVFLRRARGYAPLPLELPLAAVRPLVAVGPHLKNTFTLAQGRTAWVSQHIGDLDDLETLEYFRRTLAEYRRLFGVDPDIAVRDAHPGYLSTRVADELGLEHVISVQHHHAHIAAVAAEHGRTDRVVGVAYDGTGYGDDGTVWGAEVLVANLAGYERVGHLTAAPLPGGDLAIRRPWRAALGYLSLAPEAASAFARAFHGVDPAERELATRQIERRLNAPLASSMGRLFDAAAAVLGVRGVAHYEGQAAMELEALAGERVGAALPFPLGEDTDGRWLLDPLPLLVALGEGIQRGISAADLAAAFHESVAVATSELACRAARRAGLDTVALGGGVFQNARLLAATRRRLEDERLHVLVPQRLSPNDGAISYGQAAVAAALLER